MPAQPAGATAQLALAWLGEQRGGGRRGHAERLTGASMDCSRINKEWGHHSGHELHVLKCHMLSDLSSLIDDHKQKQSASEGERIDMLRAGFKASQRGVGVNALQIAPPQLALLFLPWTSSLHSSPASGDVRWGGRHAPSAGTTLPV